MDLITNIVLTGNYGRTSPYVIQLLPEDEKGDYKFVHQQDETYPGEHVMFFNSSLDHVLSKKGNEWYEEEDLEGRVYELKNSKIRLYFPQYSADTFSQKCIYILDLSIYIKGKEVEIGCFKFQRKDALACPPKRFIGMDEYVEYIDFEIPDPYEIYYDKNDNIPDFIKDHSIIDNAAQLYVSLHIVDPYGNKYIKKDGWTGTQNSIAVLNYNGLRADLEYEKETNDLVIKLLFNTNYGEYLKDYIENVYNFKVTSGIKWEFVVMDDTDIFFDWCVITDNFADFNIDFNGDFKILLKHIHIDFEDLKNFDDNKFFNSWDNWKDGLYLVAAVSVSGVDPRGDECAPTIKAFSNKLPLTKDLFSKMLNHNGFPSQINLNDVNMNNVTINAINTIENNIQSITYKTESQKNHMIQPVFYQTREMNKVIIHPAVTENISLNLETYKPYVKRFLLQLEGVSFKEIGRTSQGIIFKIFGNMLPKSVNEGTAYILDQDMNLVTTGKYKYEF